MGVKLQKLEIRIFGDEIKDGVNSTVDLVQSMGVICRQRVVLELSYR